MHGKRSRILSYALTLLLSLSLASAGTAADKEIRIGAVYPLSGNIASTGLDCLHGAELAVDIINGKYPELNLPLAKNAGLPNLGGAKLKLVVADTKGEPRNGQAEACLLYTSPSPRDRQKSRMPSSA